MRGRWKIGERIELTPGARKLFPQHEGRGVVVGVGGMLMRVRVDGLTRPQTWHMRHWQAASEVKAK